MSDTVSVDARGVLAPGDVGSEGVRQINRRQLLTGLAFLGVGAAGATLASLWIVLSPVRTLTDLDLTPS